jgi:hypothetical protein
VGVADDRQQGIEEERDDGRDDADAAEHGDEKGQQRQRRDRLQHRDQAEQRRCEPRPSPRRDADRHAGGDCETERAEDEKQVLRRQAAEVGREQALQQTRPLASRPCAPGDPRPARKSRAASAKLAPSISTRPFMAIIAAASMLPASGASGAASTPMRISTTASYLGKNARSSSSTRSPSRPSLASVE